MSTHRNSHQVNRRSFLKSTSALAASAAFAGIGGLSSALSQENAGKKLAEGVPNAEKLGWRVGVQAFTFHRFTLSDAIDMTASLGLKYIETFSGHRISKDEPHGIYSGSGPQFRDKLKSKLAQ